MLQYRKLSRKKRSLLGSTQLWLCDDHVLMVRSSRFAEEYRRFQLADVQALVACETPPRLAMQIALMIGATLMFLGMISAGNLYGRIFLAFIALSLLAIAAYEIVRGQRCRCRLLTEVSSEVLDPITRTSDYRRLLSVLMPALEAVQGQFPIEQNSEAIAGLTLRPAYVKPDEQGPTGASKYLQHALYGILLINAASFALGYVWRAEEGFSLAISILVAEIFFTAFLLLRSRQFGVEGSLKVLLGVVGVLLALDLASGLWQGGYLIYSIAEAGRTNSTPPKLWDLPWAMVAGKISIGWRVFVGATGLILLWMTREAKEAPPSPL